MKNFGRILMSLLVFWLWLVLVRTFYICGVKDLCSPESDVSSITRGKKPLTLTVSADGIRVLDNFPEFVFDFSSTSFENSDDYTLLYDKLAAMLKSQPNSRLMITGYYLENEKKNDAFENLGLARAMSVADKIAKEFEISSGRILTSGEITKDSVLDKPLQFEMLGYIPSGELLQAREEENFKKQWKDSITIVSYNGLLAIFEPNITECKIVPAFEEFTVALKAYLQNEPKAKILLIGHSDSHQSEAEAKKTAMNYAKMLDKQLKKTGIKNRIELKSAGKTKKLVSDVLPDNTADVLATAKNRRVEIIVIKPSKKKNN
jgi:outer membrane protein OmpA-like peptidoglycan-associated protein